jgi:cytochrome c556
MRKLSVLRKVTLAGALMAALAVAGVGSAQVKQGKSRPVKTAQLMRGVMKPNCQALKKGLDGNPSEEAWSELADNAALLNELSYLLMEDGRCPDAVWAEAASKTLRQGSADVLKAIDAKDLAAARTAFANMTKACSACHDKHKESK